MQSGMNLPAGLTYYIITVDMRNSYLRPLDLNFAHNNEIKFHTQQIPPKFLPEPDDYQKRQTSIADALHIEEINAPFEPPLQADLSPMPNIQKVQSMTFQSPFISPPHQSHQSLLHSDVAPEETPQKVTLPQKPQQQSFLACCQDKPQEGQMCQRCVREMCQNCAREPLRTKSCTRCLQRLCVECKRSLGILFPDYKIRNYPINLKKVGELHFLGCSCTLCSTKH